MHPPPYTPSNLCTFQVSNQITLTGRLESTIRISPKISDERPPTVDAMIWFCLQPEPQVGQLLPIPMDFAPQKTLASLEPQCLHRTHILCIPYIQHYSSLDQVSKVAQFELPQLISGNIRIKNRAFVDYFKRYSRILPFAEFFISKDSSVVFPISIKFAIFFGTKR